MGTRKKRNSAAFNPIDVHVGKRLASEAAFDSRPCPINGNIGNSGARIYHMPGGKYYSRTKISESKGERWFCSEDEARAAGWRRSKR